MSSSSSVRICPKAAVTTTSGARAFICSTPSGLRMRSNWNTGMPRSSANCLTGQAVSFLPLPAGRSGCVTTPTMSYRPSSASALSEGTAKSGVPMNTRLYFFIKCPFLNEEWRCKSLRDLFIEMHKP